MKAVGLTLFTACSRPGRCIVRSLTMLLVCSSFCCFAQYTIKGRVINQASTRPVEGASVFISGATAGGRTGEDGAFVISNLKPGKYQLVVSILGFDKYSLPVSIDDNDLTLPLITLSPQTIALSEVKIKAGNDFARSQYYESFKETFLGKSELAKECKIVNPELLDLDYDNRTGTLKASSVDFLIIKNDALGYRLKFLLADFLLNDADPANRQFSYSGSVFFEKMEGTAAEEAAWKVRRQEAYEGSQLHFLRSALNNRLGQEGFMVLRYAITLNARRPPDSIITKKIKMFRAGTGGGSGKNNKDSLKYWEKTAKLPVAVQQRLLNIPLQKKDIVRLTDQPGLYALTPGGADALYIEYDRDHHYRTGGINHLSDNDNTYATLVNFKAPAFFDANGSVINPTSLGFEGAWVHSGIATLVPVDYEPMPASEVEPDSLLIKKIATRVSGYTAASTGGKVYLHFDKPYYVAGDTIYYSGYVTEGLLHKPATQSVILHAELIGPDNSVVRSAQLLIGEGKAWGDFALPDTLKSGRYRVRAYTQLMRNDSEPNYFEQSFAVGSLSATGIPESGSGMPIIKQGKPVIRFLPEGGSLVTGVKSKIAFKALAGNGLGIDVKGIVLDSDGKQVASFASSHLGMGYFYLTPADDKTYYAKLLYADNTEDMIELPRSEVNGISMEASTGSRSLTFRIGSSKAFFGANKNKLFTLMAYQGAMPQSITCKLDKQEVTATLSKKNLHTGIVKVTLFNTAAEPLCERLVFVQNNDLLKLNLSADKPVFNSREKVSVQLNADNGGKPAAGHYSVSVIDESKVKTDDDDQPTIINNLLLTSELRGYVEQPNYYFDKPSDKTAADLDLVMLTHGYRSFEWKQILKGDIAPASFKAEKGLTISGLVKKNNKPVAGAKVKLFSKGVDAMVLDTVADAGGRFVFDRLAFSDNTKFVIQARNANGDKNVEVEPASITAVPTITPDHLPFGPANKAVPEFYMQNSRQFREEQKIYNINGHTQMLKEVTITEKKIVPFEHSQNLNGKGNADQVITADWLETSGYSSLYDAVRAKATGIRFTKLHRLVSERSPGPDEYMQVIVDGTPLYDKDFIGLTGLPSTPLDNLDAGDIESVEIILGAHGGAIYGATGANGLVIVTTKWAKRVNNYYKDAPGVIVYKPQGFYKARTFYSPQYDNPKTNQKMSDLRSTIYWNPDIVPDKDGKASFSYFNADSYGTYRIEIEGMDADGNLGRQVLRYKVQ